MRRFLMMWFFIVCFSVFLALSVSAEGDYGDSGVLVGASNSTSVVDELGGSSGSSVVQPEVSALPATPVPSPTAVVATPVPSPTAVVSTPVSSPTAVVPSSVVSPTVVPDVVSSSVNSDSVFFDSSTSSDSFVDASSAVSSELDDSSASLFDVDGSNVDSVERTIWTADFDTYTPTEGFLFLLFALAMIVFSYFIFWKGVF